MKFKLFITVLFLLSLLNFYKTDAQILRDSISLKLVKEGIDNIYNLRFNDAELIFKKIAIAYPGHPSKHLFNGLINYWTNYPLTNTSPTSASFESELRKCIELCEIKGNSPDEAEYLLTNMAARGFLLLFYSENDLTMDVIPLAASTYPYIRRSFDYTSVFNDFFFFTGLYNYTREAYPEAYPVYKTLAFLFPKGDKLKGLAELRGAAKNSILFKAESSLFLSGISLSIENDFEQACVYSKTLHEQYPANLAYLALFIRNLLLITRYDEAEMIMKSSVNDLNNAFYQSQLSVFNGIIQEKKYHNDKLAEQYYTKGVKEISRFGHIGYEFAAYGYFGLSRISSRKGEENYKKTYRKKAYELTDFKKINFD